MLLKYLRTLSKIQSGYEAYDIQKIILIVITMTILPSVVFHDVFFS